MSSDPTQHRFGRDRWQQSSEEPPAAAHQPNVPEAHQTSPGIHSQMQDDGPPPPPPGYRGLPLVIFLYIFAAWSLGWTAIWTSIFFDEADGPDADDLGMMTFWGIAALGSLITTMLTAAWLVRIHRKRAEYQQILEADYRRRYGLDG